MSSSKNILKKHHTDILNKWNQDLIGDDFFQSDHKNTHPTYLLSQIISTIENVDILNYEASKF